MSFTWPVAQPGASDPAPLTVGFCQSGLGKCQGGAACRGAGRPSCPSLVLSVGVGVCLVSSQGSLCPLRPLRTESLAPVEEAGKGNGGEGRRREVSSDFS